MVDHMSVEGGPGSATNVKKIAGIVFALLCCLLLGGTLAAVLTLSKTISCHDDDVKYFVNKVDLPTITEVSPKYVCLAEGARTISFTGTGVYSYNGDLPTLVVGNSSEVEVTLLKDGTDLEIWQQEVLVHTEFEATLPELSTDGVTTPDITLKQPVPEVPSAHFTSDIPTYVESGCTVTSNNLVVVPRPVVDRIFPKAFCANTKQKVIIDGKYFSFITGSAAAPAAPATTQARKRQVNETTTAVPMTTTTASSGNATTTVASGTTTGAAGTTAPATTVAGGTNMPAPANPTAASPPPGEDLIRTETSVSLAMGNLNITEDITGTICDAAMGASDLQVCEQIEFEVDVNDISAPSDDVLPFLLTNPDPLGCTSEEAQIVVVPPLVVRNMTPPVLFPKSEDVRGVVTGENFLKIDSVPPTIHFYLAKPPPNNNKMPAGTPSYTAVDVQTADCKNFANKVQICKTLSFVLPAGSTHDGPVTLSVSQPAPVSDDCGRADEPDIGFSRTMIQTALLAPPFIESISKPIACPGTELVLTGDFYKIGMSDTAVEFNGMPVESTLSESGGAGDRIQIENFGQVEVFKKLTITNFAAFYDGSSMNATTPSVQLVQTTLPLPTEPYDDLLTLVPPPQIQYAPLGGVCGANEQLEFIGDWIVQVGDNLPTFKLGAREVSGTFKSADCVEFESVSAANTTLRCTAVSVNAGTVTNNEVLNMDSAFPLECGLETPIPLRIIPNALSLAGKDYTPSGGAAGSEICLGGLDQKIVIPGPFPSNNGSVPQLILNDEVYFEGFCSSPAAGNNFRCNEVTFPIVVETALANLDILQRQKTIKAKLRATVECTSNEFDLEGSRVGRLTAVTPNRVCAASPTMLSLDGTLIAETNPKFLLPDGNIELDATASSCTAGLCTKATATLDPSQVNAYIQAAETVVQIGISNGAQCRSGTDDLLTIVPQPRIAQLLSSQDDNKSPQMCHDQEAVVRITGTGFTDQFTVKLEDASGTVTTVDQSLLTFVSASRVDMIVRAETLEAGKYTVILQNTVAGGMDECVGRSPELLHVHPVVNVRAISPGIMPKELGIRATVHVSGIVGVGTYKAGKLSFPATATANATAINTEIVDGMSEGTASAFLAALGFADDLSDNTDYFVRFESQIGCVGTSEVAMFKVKPTTPGAIASILPSASPAGSEIVIRKESGSWSLGAEVYGRNFNLTKGRNVQRKLPGGFVLPDGSVRAIVSADLAPNVRDLVDIFVLDRENDIAAKVVGGWRPTGTRPRRIDVVSVSPSTLRAESGVVTLKLKLSQDLTIDSCNYACSAQDGSSPVENSCVISTASGDIAVQLTGSDLTPGHICRVTVAGAEASQEGNTRAVSNGIAVLGAAGEVSAPLSFADALTTSRENPCGVVNLVPPRAGAVPQPLAFVLGGKGASALASTESAFLGQAAPVFAANRAMPQAVSGAACVVLGADFQESGNDRVIDEFLYVIGGGAGLQRARVLDPNFAPVVTATLHLNENSTTLGEGLYRYAVTAVLQGTAQVMDTLGTLRTVANLRFEDGESLPSNLATVAVPNTPTGFTPDARVELAWTLPTGTTANSTFVYRSVGNGPMQLLKVLPGTALSYVDVGADTPTTQEPPKAGSLGVWEEFTGTLNSGLQVGEGAQAVQISSDRAVIVGGATASPVAILSQRASDLEARANPGTQVQSQHGSIAKFGDVSLVLAGGAGNNNIVQVNSDGTVSAQTAGSSLMNSGCSAAAEHPMTPFLYQFGGNGDHMSSVKYGVTQGTFAVGTLSSESDIGQNHVLPACLHTPGQLFIAGGEAPNGRRVTAIVI